MPCNPGHRAVHGRDHNAAATIKRLHFPLVISPPGINSCAALKKQMWEAIFSGRNRGEQKYQKKKKASDDAAVLGEKTTFSFTPNACWLLQCFWGSGLDHQGPNQMDTHDIHQVSQHCLYMSNLLSCLRDCLLNYNHYITCLNAELHWRWRVSGCRRHFKVSDYYPPTLKSHHGAINSQMYVS